VNDWARRANADALGALVGIAVLAAAAAPGGAGAQPRPELVPAATADSAAELEGLTIARVEIRARNIFDPVPGGPLAPIYRLGNRLHIRTRTRTVRQQLLFAPGDAWSGERCDESARVLRQLDFLEPQRLEPRREGDSVVVLVETRDSWTTSPELNLERGGGEQFGTVGLTERNLLGLGKSFSVAYHEDPTGISRNLSYRDPAVLGSRIQFAYGAAAGAVGSTDVLSLSHPFYALDAPWAFGASWLRSSSVLRLFQSAGEIASLDQRLHEGEVWGGRGLSSDGTIVRAVASLLVRDRDLGPSRLAPGAPPEFAGGDEKLQLRRVGVEVSAWRPNYIVREDVDRIGHVEDFDLGSAVGIKLGLSPYVLGGTTDEGYARLRVQGGAETPLGFGFVRGSASTRLRRGPLEVLREADARWFIASRSGHVLVLAAHAAAGSRVARDFQVVVGGLSALRAYPVQALAGRELVRLNAEQRWVLGRNYWDLVSIGTAAFYDAARAWGPGAAGTGWFNAAGFGLRLATPHTALGPVLRVDIAWPISPTRDGTREAVFSFGSSQAF
jgi:hypothetical protein